MSDRQILLLSLTLDEVAAENNGCSYFDRRSDYDVPSKT
jgi:hypothetical protein